jgi:hypothetical protein
LSVLETCFADNAALIRRLTTVEAGRLPIGGKRFENNFVGFFLPDVHAAA